MKRLRHTGRTLFWGVKSEWLKTDLGFHDADGEFTFLFGRRKLSRESYMGAPLVLTFYSINTPEDIVDATHIFVLRKIRNKDDVKTECEWRDEGRFLYHITDTSADGYYWKLTVCPLGFRQVHSSGPDKYYWEQTDTTYRAYDRFVEARQDYVRTFCAKLLTAWNNGEPTEALVPDEQPDQSVATENGNKTITANVTSDTGGTAKIGGMTPDELCVQLNTRLNTLRMQPGFESLESYTYDESRKSLRGVYFTLIPTAKTKHSPAQALSYVERMEYLARMRQKYLPHFEKLRERISAAEGMLHTEDPHYVEIETPAGCFSADEKAVDRQRFSYSLSGLVAVQDYVDDLEKSYDDLLGCLAKRATEQSQNTKEN